jgi:hypothetical protein
MKYCPRCGVILAEKAVRCDLCGSAPVTEKPAAADAGGAEYPPAPDAPGGAAVEPSLTGPEGRRVVFELWSVACAIGLVVTVLVDLFVEHGITWSRYSSVGIAIAYCLLACPLLLLRRPLLLLATLGPGLLALIFLLDAVDGRISWFLGYGLPITALLEADTAAVALIIALQRRFGLNVVAIILGGVAVFCFGVESVLDLNQLGRLAPSWSVVVAFALVPTAVLLMYLHYRIVHRASLRKLFRL